MLSIRNIYRKFRPLKYEPYTEKAYRGGDVRFRFYSRHERNRVVGRGGETEFFDYVMGHVAVDDVAYDLGANVGLYSVHFAAVARRGKVVAFEPDPLIYKRLRENVRANRFRNVTTCQLALADCNSTMHLFTDGIGQYSSSLRFQEGRAGAPSGNVAVKVQPLDDFIASHPALKPTIMKIDIEGAEELMLNGSRDLFSGRYGPPPRMVFIEIHPVFLKHFGGDSSRVFDFFREFGYETDYEVRRNDEIQCGFVLR